MENENTTTKKSPPVFERRLKDIRCAVWRNLSGDGKRQWYSVNLGRTYYQGDEAREAAGSLNGLPDIALGIACLQAAQQFIEQDNPAQGDVG